MLLLKVIACLGAAQETVDNPLDRAKMVHIGDNISSHAVHRRESSNSDAKSVVVAVVAP